MDMVHLHHQDEITRFQHFLRYPARDMAREIDSPFFANFRSKGRSGLSLHSPRSSRMDSDIVNSLSLQQIP
jgi:hypothetical protein